MKHILFSEQNKKYPVALLIKEKALKTKDLLNYYIAPIEKLGLSKNKIIALSLEYNDKNKAPSKLIHSYLQSLLKAVNSIGVTTLLVADSEYFKKLTKIQSKIDQHSGYVIPCAVKGYEHISIILSLNYQALFHNPLNITKIEKGNETLASHINGLVVEPGTGVIHSSKYIKTKDSIEVFEQELNKLHEYPVLTCDIEAFSLEFHKAGIGTIAFAWDKHSGIAFQIDYKVDTNRLSLFQGTQTNCLTRKYLLSRFFREYKGKLIFHNATYDVGVLIYELFMYTDLNNIQGMVEGLKTMYSNTEDTKVITYLTVNSTAGNKLDLKSNAFDHVGNYAKEDIKDIRLIPLEELLEYNLMDCLATFYLYETNYPLMVKDNQESVYKEIFRPSLRVVSHMQLVGMPMCKAEIIKKDKYVRNIRKKAKDYLLNSQIIKEYSWQAQCKRMVEKNATLKKKVKPIEDFVEKFNPGSGTQLQWLLYDYLGLPILDTTNTGKPATGKDTLNKLLVYLKTKFNITKEDLNG